MNENPKYSKDPSFTQWAQEWLEKGDRSAKSVKHAHEQTEFLFMALGCENLIKRDRPRLLEIDINPIVDRVLGPEWRNQ